MKAPDLDREKSEMSLTLNEFLKRYNEDLPILFPRVSTALLIQFRNTHSNFFKTHDVWSLDLHRKKVMDWLQIVTLQKTL